MLEIPIARNHRSCEIKKQRKIKTIIISVTFFTADRKYDAFIIKKNWLHFCISIAIIINRNSNETRNYSLIYLE